MTEQQHGPPEVGGRVSCTTRTEPANPINYFTGTHDGADTWQFNGHPRYGRQDGYAAPDAEDHADAAVYERGFRLAARCRECGAWLVAHRSVRDHIGPVCRARVGVAR